VKLLLVDENVWNGLQSSERQIDGVFDSTTKDYLKCENDLRTRNDLGVLSDVFEMRRMQRI
jgi:hypothetical protein